MSHTFRSQSRKASLLYYRSQRALYIGKNTRIVTSNIWTPFLEPITPLLCSKSASLSTRRSSLHVAELKSVLRCCDFLHLWSTGSPEKVWKPLRRFLAVPHDTQRVTLKSSSVASLTSLAWEALLLVFSVSDLFRLPFSTNSFLSEQGNQVPCSERKQLVEKVRWIWWTSWPFRNVAVVSLM